MGQTTRKRHMGLKLTYIILRDTFGRGLQTISNIGLEVVDEHQLDGYICDAADAILSK